MSGTEAGAGLLAAARGELDPQAPYAADLILPTAWLAFCFVLEGTPLARVSNPIFVVLMTRGERSLEELLVHLEETYPGVPAYLAEVALAPPDVLMRELAERSSPDAVAARNALVDELLPAVAERVGLEGAPEPAPTDALDEPDPGDAHRTTAARLWGERAYAEARREFGICLAHGGETVVLAFRAIVSMLAGHGDAARADAEQLRARGHERGHQMVALAALVQQDHDAALAAVEEHVAAKVFGDAELLRAVVRHARGELDLAHRDVSLVLGRGESAEGRAHRAVLRAERGDLVSALEDLQVVLTAEQWPRVEAMIENSAVWQGPFRTLSEAKAWRAQLLARLLIPHPATEAVRAQIAAADLAGGLEALRQLVEDGDVEQRRAARPQAASLVKALGNDAELAPILRRLRVVL